MKIYFISTLFYGNEDLFTALDSYNQVHGRAPGGEMGGRTWRGGSRPNIDIFGY